MDLHCGADVCPQGLPDHIFQLDVHPQAEGHVHAFMHLRKTASWMFCTFFLFFLINVLVCNLEGTSH